MGCLTAPFRMLGCLVLIVALALAWLYRERIANEARDLLGIERAAPVSGRPGVRALASAESKIDSLNGWRADSVVLTPAELASLVGAGLPPELRGRLDSLQVFPRDGELAVRASLKTAKLPKDVVGPLAVVLKPTERVEVAGPVKVVRAGRAEWTVRRFSIRNIPIPARVVPRLVERAFGTAPQRAVPVRIPEGIRAIRFQSTGATLYGAAPS